MPRSLAHLHWRALRVAALAAVIVGVAVSTMPAGAASSNVVVSMQVPSATSLDNLCTSSTGMVFGTVLPGTAALTATTGSPCRFQFSSSNGMAQLRIGQSDGLATAMTDDTIDRSSVEFIRRPHRSISIEPGLASTAWTVDQWGGAFRTTNSGTTWTQLTDASTGAAGQACVRIDVVSTTTAWAGCGAGKVAQTTNTGSTWTPAGAPPTTASIEALSATSSAHAVIGTRTGEIFSTTTTGGSWTAATGLAGVTWVTAIDMVDASNGFAVGNPSGRVYRTTNGGAGWTQLTPSGASGSCNGVDAVSATEAWVSCDGFVQRTINGTSLLTTTDTGSDWSLSDIAAESANVAVAVGPRGSTFRTINGGVSWINELDPTLADLTAVASSGSTRYAVGLGDVIIGSFDSGDTWSMLRSSSSGRTLIDVDMLDGSVAWTVGERGQVRRTGDGGASWSSQISGVTTHLRGVTVLSATTAVIVGSGGVVLRTTDSGATWTPMTSNVTTDLLAVSSTPGRDLVVAVGQDGRVIRSDDRGVTWSTTRGGVGQAKLNEVSVLGSGHVLLVGDDRTLERSTDGGRTWQVLVVGATPTWHDLVAVAASHDGREVMVISGQYGTGSRSTDFGATWTSSPAIGATSARGSRLEYHGSGITSGTQYSIAHLGTGLLETLDQSDEGWNHLNGFDAIDTARSIFVGVGGLIERTFPGATISDYGAGGTWGSASTTSMFGVCLQAVAGNATASWTVDTTNVSGRCESLDTDPWRAVGIAPSLAASTTTLGGVGSVDLVWGMRPAANTPPGRYRAKVTVEVLGV